MASPDLENLVTLAHAASLLQEEAPPPQLRPPPNVLFEPKKPRSLRRKCNSPPALPTLPPLTGPLPTDFRFQSPVLSIAMPMSLSAGGSLSSFAGFQQLLSWGSRPQVLGEKQIKNSDTDTNQSRLLMPMELQESILDYATKLERRSIKSPGGLEVIVLDSVGRRYRMMCKFRASHKGMVFNGRGWNAFVKNNSLRLGHNLRVMAFRAKYKGNLCFAFL